MNASDKRAQLRAEWHYLCAYRNCTETFEEFANGVLEDEAVDRAQDACIRRCEPED
jgi:hypothetical protein